MKKGKFRRIVAWFLAVAMLSGNWIQAGIFTAFAAEDFGLQDRELGEEVEILIGQDQVEYALEVAGTEDEIRLDEDLIPFQDPTTKKEVMAFLEKALKGKVLVEQSIPDDLIPYMYVIIVDKGKKSSNLIDRLELITLNADPFQDYTFRLDVDGENLNLYDGELTEYKIAEPEIVSEEDLYTTEESTVTEGTPSQAQQARPEDDTAEGAPEEESGSLSDTDAEVQDSSSESVGDTQGAGSDGTSAEPEDPSGQESIEEKSTEASVKETDTQEETEKDTEEQTEEQTEKETEEQTETEEPKEEQGEVLSWSVNRVPRVAVSAATSDVAKPAEKEEKEEDEEVAVKGDIITKAGKKEIPMESSLLVDPLSIEEEGASLLTAGEGDATSKMVTGFTPVLTMSRMVFQNSNYPDGLKGLAEQFYGEDASEPQPVLDELTMTQRKGNGEVKAGDQVTYNITLITTNIPQYTYGDGNKDLFDAYQDCSLTMRLPDGITLDPEGNGKIQVGNRDISYQKEGDSYRFSLGDIGGGDRISFNLNMRVGENGVTPKGTAYEFTRQDLRYDTTIRIMNRTASDAGVETDLVYQKDFDMEEGWHLSTVTPDSWKVNKYVVNEKGEAAAEKDSYLLDKENSQIVVRYKVEVGLASANDGPIISDSSAYSRYGRVPMADYRLVEDISLSDRQGKPVYPDSFEVQWMAGSKKGEKIDPAPGSDAAKGKLVLDRYTTCGEMTGVDTKEVDAAAPAYTAYEVVARYPAASFYIDFDDEEAKKDQTLFTISNVASLDYALATADGSVLGGESVAEEDVVCRIWREPASLRIYKKIANTATGNDDLYNKSLASVYTGAAIFEIDRKEGGTWIPYGEIKDSIKRKVSDGVYEEAGAIAVNPQADAAIQGDGELALTGDSGYVEVYLPAGTYRVRETAVPTGTVKGARAEEEEKKEFTIAENQTATATFVNQSSSGSIQFAKKSRSIANPNGAALSGAVFGLWPAEGDMTEENRIMITRSEDKTGEVTFYPVTEGSYRIQEISANGYIVDRNVYTAEVKTGEVSGISLGGTPAPEVVNIKNEAKIVIQKRITAYKDANGVVREEAVVVPNGDYGLFKQAFTVQKETEGGVWVTADPVPGSSRKSLEGFGLETGSQITLELPVRDAQGNAIRYRVVETLPEGYYASNSDMTLDDGRVVYNIGTLNLLQDESAAASTVPARVMKNSRYGQLQIQKSKTSLNSAGTGFLTVPADYRFRLYRKSGDQYVPVSGQDVLTTSKGKGQFKNLPVVESQGGTGLQMVEYYLEELALDADAAPADSQISGDKKVEATIDGVKKTLAGPYTLDTQVAVEAKVANVAREIPYWIKKVDKNHTGKVLSGAKFNVYRFADPASDTEEPEKDPAKKVNGSVLVTGRDGYAYIKLAPDAKYRVVEVEAPKGYLLSGEDGRHYQDISTSGKGVQPGNPVQKGDSDYTVKFENQPKVKARIAKTLVDSTGISTSQKVTFDIYTKDAAGKMVEAGFAVSNQSFELDPGQTYYFREGNGDWLSPNLVKDLWFDAGAANGSGAELHEEDGFLYIKWTAPEGRNVSGTDVVIASVKNYYDGSIQVQKNDSRSGRGLKGAKFGLYKIVNGEVQETPAAEVTSDASGNVLFKEVPVFDQGERITYEIREISPAPNYHKTDKTIRTQVVPGKTITHEVMSATWNEQQDKPLEFGNEPYFSITASKVWRNDWTYSFYPVDHGLGGVQIALYEKDAQGGFTYTGKSEVTAEDGSVTFDQLDRTHAYYLVEVAPVGDKQLPAGKQALPLEDGLPKSSIAADEMEHYNYVAYNAGGNKPSTDTKIELKDPLVNHKPWAQINITKVCTEDGTCELPGHSHSPYIDRTRFELYRQNEKPEPGAVLSVPNLTVSGPNASIDASGLTDMGEYVTGVKLDLDGKRAPGEFDTTILDYGEVYWLVETGVTEGFKAGPKRIFAFVPADGDVPAYTLPEGSEAELVTYGRNEVTSYQVVNPHDPIGPGAGEAYTAQIWLLKWLKQTDPATGKDVYTELGGATYELWLADGSGNKVLLLDTVETGLETRGDNLRGQAITDYVDLKALAASDAYKAYITRDEVGKTMTANLILVETKAPDKVVKDTAEHKLTITVKQGENLEEKTYYWEPGDEDGTGVNQGRERLVNGVQEQYDVRIVKYGYHVTEDLLGLTDEELHARLDDSQRERLKGVKFHLESGKQNNNGSYTWSKVEAGDLSTDANGEIRIEGGLPAGLYRLQEYFIPSPLDKKYEPMYKYTSMTFRYFRVEQNVDVHIYNPDLPGIRVRKTRTDSTPVNGYSFNISNAENSNLFNGDFLTGADGWLTQTVPSGSYWIKENQDGAQGLTSKYYSNTSPIQIGYKKTENKFNPDREAVLEKRGGSNSPFTMQYEVAISNPAQVTIKLAKTDEESGKALAGAKFQVEWKRFTVDTADGYAGKISDLNRPAPDSTGWTQIVKSTTDAKGMITIPNAAPGWYRITELSAPAGYSMNSEDGSHMAVIGVNSDLPLAAGLEEEYEQAKNAGWLYEGMKNEMPVTVSITNRPFRKIQIQKQMRAAQGVTLTDAAVKAALEDIRFEVYRKKADGAFERLDVCERLDDGSYREVGTLSFSGEKHENGSYLFDGAVPDLADGESYYIKEVLGKTAARDWILSPDVQTEDGYIPVSEETDRMLSAQVQNVYQKASFTIRKVDVGSPNTGVPGAEFAVYGEAPALGEDGHLIPNEGSRIDAAITEGVGADAGTYTFVVPAGAQARDYFVVETKAPATYVGTSDYITLSLKAGDRKDFDLSGIDSLTKGNKADYLPKQILTNEKGVEIRITKYSNIKGKAAQTDRMAGATFVLYYQIDGKWNVWQEAGTDENGEIRFPNVPLQAGWNYAIRELPFTQDSPYSGYRLDSLWRGEDQMTAEEIDLGTGAEEGGKAQAFVLRDLEPGEAISYEAYNQPTAGLKLIKKDYNPQAAGAPEATFAIYPIASGEGDGAELGGELMRVKTKRVDGQNYTEAQILKLQPGKYRIQEIQTDLAYNLILDDNRLVFYKDIEVKAGDKELEPLTFSNMQAQMGVSIGKTGTNRIGSLFAGSRDIRYTLTPGAEASQPLLSYTVTDGQLKMYHADSSQKRKLLDAGQYAENKYAITGLTVKTPGEGGLTYENHIKGAEDITPNVTAKVTVFRSDGSGSTYNVSSNQDGSVPFGTEIVLDPAERYQTFQVVYEDAALKERTGYALGSGFVPGTIEVGVTVDQQSTYLNGTEELSQSIDAIANQADVKLEYWKWNHEGEKEKNEKTDQAIHTTVVEGLSVPTVSLEKAVDKRQAAIGETLTYDLTVRNETKQAGQETDAEYMLKDPVIVDTLPLGLEVKEIAEITKGAAGVTLESSSIMKDTDGRQVAMIRLKGGVLPEEAVTVQLKAVVTGSVIRNSGSLLVNEAYVTTREKGIPQYDNPLAATFKNKSGQWANEPDSTTYPGFPVAKSLMDGTGLGEHGYVSDRAETGMSAAGDLTLMKGVEGNKNPGRWIYDNQVARVSNGVDESDPGVAGSGGWANYHLIVKNGASSPTVSGLRVADLLPDLDDHNLEGTNGTPRNSEWKMNFDHITKVSAGGQELNESQYQVYVTTLPFEQANTEARKVLDKSRPAIDAGMWSQDIPDTQQGKAAITALLVEITDPNVKVEPNETLEIYYHATVPAFAGEEFEKNSYKYAVNDFSAQYLEEINGASYSVGKLTSNKVQVVLEPADVEVGGRIWIDANNNGIQDDDAFGYDYYGNPSIQAMLKNTGVDLTVYTGADDKQGSSQAFVKPVGDWDGRFKWTGLSPAAPYEESVYSLYRWDKGILQNVMDPMALKTSGSVSHYLIGVEKPEGFDLARKTAWDAGAKEAGKSREPKDLQPGGAYQGTEAMDSNFRDGSSEYLSENFFLWSTADVFDHTKDIGLVKWRSAEVKKQDASGAAVSDTSFAIYGPFEYDATAEDMKAAIGQGNPVYAGTTGADGAITAEAIGGKTLLGYQKYLLVETGAAPNYVTDGATAEVQTPGHDPVALEAVDLGNGQAAWILPFIDYDPTKTLVETISVKDRYATGALQFTKEDGDSHKDLAGAVFALSRVGGKDYENVAHTFALYAKRLEQEQGRPATGIADVKVVGSGAELSVEFTAANAKVELRELPYGDYELKEVKAPQGYFPLNEGRIYAFTINDAHPEGKLSLKGEVVDGNRIPNERSGVNGFTIRKRSTVGQAGIQGITFQVEGPGTYAGGWNPFGQKFKPGNGSGTGIFETDVDGVLKVDGLPYGTYRVTESASSIYKTVKPFYVVIDQNGAVDILVTEEDDKGQIVLTAAADGAEIVVYNAPLTGSVELEKVDTAQPSKTLAGAEFTITGQSDAPGAWEGYLDQIWATGISQVTRDGNTLRFRLDGTEVNGLLGKSNNGRGKLEKVPYGTYTITEVKPPEGYILGENPWTAQIKISKPENGGSDEVKFITPGLFEQTNGAVANEKNRLEIVKSDSRDPLIRLGGAQFIVKAKGNGGGDRYAILDRDHAFAEFTQERAKATVVTTESQGEGLGTAAIYGLPAGPVYELVEVKAPEGYRVRTDADGNAVSVRFEINEQAHTQLQVENDKDSARAAIRKVSASNLTKGLAGAQFGIYTSDACTDDTRVALVTTDAQGYAETVDLPLGTYYVKELKAPAGYLIRRDIYTVHVRPGADGILYDRYFVPSVVAGQTVDYITNSYSGQENGGNSSGNNSGGGSGGSGGPGGPGVPGEDAPIVVIDPDQVPLAAVPTPMETDMVQQINDGEIPLANIPKTGKKTSAAVHMMLLSSSLLMAMGIIKKKEKKY